MAPRDRLNRSKGRNGRAGRFLALPAQMTESPQWARLSSHAVRLIVDLGAQYNGGNNGDLCATWALMKRKGWRSPGTLRRALLQAQGSGFVELTRQGGRHCPSLYALTFLKIDPCGGKLHVPAAPVPSHRWKNVLASPAAYQSATAADSNVVPMRGKAA